MKKTKLRVLSQEQPAPLETSIFAEQQAQAKSGVITAASGADATIKALGDANPVTNTLAGVMRDAFGAASADKRAIINLATRKVTILPAATNIAALTGAAGVVNQGEITFVDPTKATGPMESTADNAETTGAVILDLLAAVTPSYSVESICNKLEDAITDPEGAVVAAGKSAIIVVNQADKTIKVYDGDEADIAALDGASLAEDAEFVQTLQAAGGRQFGE